MAPRIFFTFVALVLPVSLVTAEPLSLAQCERLTHPAHGGEQGHRDFGEGRVLWADWWSMEGTSTDLTLMDCASGDTLQFRTAETNMTPGRAAFDRTDLALETIELHETGARAFATLDRIGADLEKTAKDITRYTSTEESCACAALYPDMRGDKVPFILKIIEAGIGPVSQ